MRRDITVLANNLSFKSNKCNSLTLTTGSTSCDRHLSNNEYLAYFKKKVYDYDIDDDYPRMYVIQISQINNEETLALFSSVNFV